MNFELLTITIELFGVSSQTTRRDKGRRKMVDAVHHQAGGGHSGFKRFKVKIDDELRFDHSV